MQALSNFTWIPNLMQTQVPPHHHHHHHNSTYLQHRQEKMACSKPRPSVMTDLPLFKNLKRKRADDSESPEHHVTLQETASPDLKRQKSEITAAVAQRAPSLAQCAQLPAAPAANTPQEATSSTPPPPQAQVASLGSHRPKAAAEAAASSVATASHCGSSPQPFGTSPAQTTKAPTAVDVPVQPPPTALHTSTGNEAQPAPRHSMPLKLKDTPEAKAKAREVIESQLNLELLLKHQELRLIEQEIAKCQVSLEQIRRCQIIPYPGQEGSQATHEQISTGSGPALEPARGSARPQHPAPWGVTDGPYTRHYAKWLIPDPTFDSGFPVTRTSTGGKGFGSAGAALRSTRGSYFDFGSASASRHHRGSVGSKFHVLSNNCVAAPAKERHGPLIIKRPSDGQYVKLVCKFCQKDNISSVQGFLNHCRIAHQKSYESHGEAAEECGIVMDSTEANAALTTPTTEQSSQSQPQSQSQQPMLLQQAVLSQPAPTPTSAVATPHHGKPFVHPLITQSTPQQVRPITLTKPKAKAKLSSNSVVAATVGTQNCHAASVSISPAEEMSLLVPSLQTPKLSALLQKRGIVGNLRRLVTSSQEKCDIDAIQYIGQDDTDEVHGNSGAASSLVDNLDSSTTHSLTAKTDGSHVPQQQSAASRVPSRGAPSSQLNIGGMTGSLGASGNLAATSAKSSASVAERFTPSASFDQEGCLSSDTGYSREMGLSPHTLDTNPGLTEDEAYEPDEDSDREQSTTDDHASPATDTMDIDLDVEVRDFGDGSSHRRNGIRRHSRGHEEHFDNSHEVKNHLPAHTRLSGAHATTAAAATATATAATTTNSVAVPPTVPAKRKRGRPAKERKCATDKAAGDL